VTILLAILACYRVSELIAIDDGPYKVFSRLRQGLGRRAALEQRWNKEGVWSNLAELVQCPYCIGVWVAALFALLLAGDVKEFLLMWLGIAGGQSVLQGLIDHND
jgi:hypothetical protein